MIFKFFFFYFGFIQGLNQCIKNGEICSFGQYCCDPVAKCKATASYGIFRCIAAVLLGQYCTNFYDCRTIKNAVCLKNSCVCSENFMPVNSTICLPVLGGKCQRGECFPVNSQCIHSRCQCRGDYFPYENKLCLPNYTSKAVLCAPVLDGFCISDNDCKLSTLQCIDYKCQCRYGSIKHTSECRRPLNTIECLHNDQCSTKNSICDKTCKCSPNFYLKDDVCLPGFGQYCSDEACAAENSYCFEQKCQCRPGFRLYHNICLLINAGTFCISDTDCMDIGNAECRNNQCICKGNYVISDRTHCVSVNEILCSSKDRCKQVNAECIDNECQCQAKILLYSNVCLPTKLGQFCVNDDNCYKIKNSICSEKKMCVCKSTFSALNATYCGSLLGGFCDDDNDCPEANFNCIYSKCQCKTGFMPFTSSKCINESAATVCNRKHSETRNNTLPAKYLGSYCINETYCDIPNSNCIDHKCQCRPNYTSSSNRCILRPLGSQCNSTFDCKHIKNGVCSSEKICACIHKFSGVSKYQCSPNLGGRCANSSDCYVHRSDCIGKICQCSSNYSVMSDYQCELTSQLATCSENSHCVEPWHFKCSNNKCVCNDNNFSTAPWTCQPILGGACWFNHQCITLNARCIDYRCRCSKPFKRLSDNQCVNPILSPV